LKPTPARREKIKYTFDVSKCDKIFDILLQANQIRIKGGHVIPPPEELAKRAYCKWHNSFSHATNDCNVFRRQVQSAINDGRLTFTEGSKMKLDSDPFPINMIDFENKKVLIRSDQAESLKGKNVIVDNRAAPRMIKPKNPEEGVWKVNEGKKQVPKLRPTVKHLLDKYVSQKANNVFNRLGGSKRPRSPSGHGFCGQLYRQGNSYAHQPQFPMGPTSWGCAPPMYPQFPPYGFNP